MLENLRFPVFVVVSLLALVAILLFVTARRRARPPLGLVLGTAAVVVVGGMAFAKLGQNAGWPWWVYYTVPALATLLVPPVVLRLSPGELSWYLVLAALSSPVIHVLFSFFLGWHEYMPFIRIPSLEEILGDARTVLRAAGDSWDSVNGPPPPGMKATAAQVSSPR